MAVEQIERDDPAADVRAAINSLNEKGAASPGASQPPEAPESPPVPAQGDPEAALDKAAADDRPRDDKGRFVAAEKAPEPDKPITATPDAKPAPATTPQPVVAKPPPGWSPEAKAEWLKLSPALQQAVVKREEEVSSGFKQKSDELRRWQELEGIVAPRRSYYQRFGFQNDAQAINHLFTLSDSMERDPAATLAYLAQHYRVDLNRLAGGQPQPNLQPQQQFQPQQLPPDINAVVQEQIGLEFARQEIQSFAADPEHGHFEEVKPMMQAFLDRGQAKDLQSAYDMAIWATPHLRQEILDRQAQEAAAKAAEEAAKKAAEIEKKTKATNASLTGAPHGTPATPRKAPRGSFDDVAEDVRNAVAAHR